MSRATRRRAVVLTATGLLTAMMLIRLSQPSAPDDTSRTITRSAPVMHAWTEPDDRLVHTAAADTSLPSSEEATLRLIRQLALAGDEEGLFRLRSLLGDPRTTDGLRIAGQLLRETDPRLRQEGVDLLGQYSLTDSEAYRQALHILQTETDPLVLVRLLHHLDAPIDAYGKGSDISVALHALLSHPHEEVRSQAILQMLQWDDYASIEGYLYQALNDPSGEVRLSAATVIGLIDTRSSTLKSALLALRNNPQETRDMRESIDAALTRIDDYSREYPDYQ